MSARRFAYAKAVELPADTLHRPDAVWKTQNLTVATERGLVSIPVEWTVLEVEDGGKPLQSGIIPVAT